jgi:hypothetical protein
MKHGPPPVRDILLDPLQGVQLTRHNLNLLVP